jgi:hypothetical protein
MKASIDLRRDSRAAVFCSAILARTMFRCPRSSIPGIGSDRNLAREPGLAVGLLEIGRDLRTFPTLL